MLAIFFTLSRKLRLITVEDPLFDRFLMHEQEEEIPDSDEELPAAEYIVHFSEDEVEDEIQLE